MKYLIFVLSFLLFGCDHSESAEYNRESKIYKSSTQDNLVESKNKLTLSKVEVDTSILYKVVGITDGDTYKLLKDNSQIIIRSARINCPEKNQPFGQKTKQFVSDLCFGKYVTLRHNNKYDRNHRLIAAVILENESNLNKLIVENGLAL
jgi:endonuclease YncB( thermonuclease family)